MYLKIEVIIKNIHTNKMKTHYFLYLVLILLIVYGCDTDPIRREKLGTKNNIMTDQEGNKWLIKHSVGSSYKIEYLTDSTGVGMR